MSDNKTVYVLFDVDYHRYFAGVFSSEKEACKEALALDQYRGYPSNYLVKAYSIDTNNEVEDCKRANDFLDWCLRENERIFGDEEMEYEDALRMTELHLMEKFNEVFGN